jgi:hypothetical protein
MRKFISFYLTLPLLILLLLSCTSFRDIGAGNADYLISWLAGPVVCLSKDSFSITTKDDLLEYVENNTYYRTVLNVKYHYAFDFQHLGDSVKVYLQLTYDGKPVIYAEYPQGMPIMMYRYNAWRLEYQSRIVKEYSWLEAPIRLGKPIIMINGYVELADSSYNDYIILPVAPNSIGASFDVRKCSFKLKYKDRNGKLRDFKEYFEI